MKFIKTLSMASILVAAMTSSAVSAEDSNKNEAIKQKMYSIGLEVNEINDSEIPGLKEVISDRGIFYVSADGQYLVAGRMFDMNNGMTNLTDQSLAKLRLEGISKFKDSMIVFPAENEKHRITVFTDTTCGYCKKLHGEMADYNKLGITVQYLGFPRGGLQSTSYDNLQNVWCADDQQGAMTAFKSGSSVSSKACATKVAQHYELGQAAGVTGTPAIILDDGSLIGGYKPPRVLLRDLEAQ